jgi:hypothetical protein
MPTACASTVSDTLPALLAMLDPRAMQDPPGTLVLLVTMDHRALMDIRDQLVTQDQSDTPEVLGMLVAVAILAVKDTLEVWDTLDQLDTAEVLALVLTSRTACPRRQPFQV